MAALWVKERRLGVNRGFGLPLVYYLLRDVSIRRANRDFLRLLLLQVEAASNADDFEGAERLQAEAKGFTEVGRGPSLEGPGHISQLLPYSRAFAPRRGGASGLSPPQGPHIIRGH